MPKPLRAMHVQATLDLLDKPVISAEQDPDAFRRIGRCYGELQEWYASRPGWVITTNRSMVRLIRTPGMYGPSTSINSDGRSVGLGGLRSPREYVMLTLILYFAEYAGMSSRAQDIGEKFVISALAERLSEISRDGRFGVPMDFSRHDERGALSRVLRYLEELGALRWLDGSIEAWSEQQSEHDGAYEFTDIAYRIAPHIPAAEELEPIAQLRPYARRQALRDNLTVDQRAWRVLLTGPALFSADDPAAYGLIAQRRSAFAREIRERMECELDLYNHMARILRTGHAQDAGGVVVSCRRSEFDVILILCGRLQDQVRSGRRTLDGDDCLDLRVSEVIAEISQIRAAHHGKLSATMTNVSAKEMSERVLGVMRASGVARGPDDEGRLYITPMAALYRAKFVEGEAEDEAGDVVAESGA